MKIVINTSKLIQNIINKNNNTHTNLLLAFTLSNTWTVIKKNWVRETSRSIQKWIYEHKKGLEKGEKKRT